MTINNKIQIDDTDSSIAYILPSKKLRMETAVIDAEDIPLIRNHKWGIYAYPNPRKNKQHDKYLYNEIFVWARKRGTRYNWVHPLPYVEGPDMVYLANVVMGVPTDTQIDRLNGNWLDCRKENLCVAGIKSAEEMAEENKKGAHEAFRRMDFLHGSTIEI